MNKIILERILTFNSLIAFLVGIVFLIIGLRLLINNRVITKNLLRNVGIFQTKEVERDKKEISVPKLVFNRIMVFIVGIVFASVGLFLLINIFR